jgi:VanZ family protein
MGLIFFFSSRPGDDLPRFGTWDFFLKKGGHLFGYALLGAAYRRGLTHGKPPGRSRVVLAVVLAACYAATDEWHQRFVPGRGPSPVDVLIDTAGAALGAIRSSRRCG